jgi:hypothetical protein
MLDRIEVDVIDVSLEIPLIADGVFPKSALPQPEFSIPMARDGSARFRDGVREPAFDQPPPIWVIRISRRQRHDDMQMVGQHHDRIDGERVRRPRYANGRTQGLDVID